MNNYYEQLLWIIIMNNYYEQLLWRIIMKKSCARTQIIMNIIMNDYYENLYKPWEKPSSGVHKSS